MVSGKQSLENRASIQGYVEKEEKEDFNKIRWREGLTESELLRIAVKDYIKIHKSGNTTYILDDFAKNKDMIAIPALMTDKSKLSDYVKDEKSYEELEKVKNQAKFLVDIINTKLMNTVDPKKKEVSLRKTERLINENDMRLKNPKDMTWNQKIIYSQVMSQERENGREVAYCEKCDTRFMTKIEDRKVKCVKCENVFVKPKIEVDKLGHEQVKN